MITQKFPLFGSEVEFRIYDVEPDDFVTLGLVNDIYRKALRLQKIFNLYDPKSELNILNKNGSIKASGDLLFVIKKSIQFSILTNGKYDPTHGRNFLLRKKGRSTETLDCSYKDIMITDNNIELLNDKIIIDLGSIAKGYIVDRLIEYMKDIGIEHGFIDARGDMKIFGKIPEVIEIQHPRLDKGIHPLIFENMAIATSGDYNQYVKDFRDNHIVGSSDLISVTVLDDSLTNADALATCLMLMGKDDALRYCENNNISALLIDDQLNEYGINIKEKYLEGTEWIKKH